MAKYNFFINVGEDYLREMWAYICPELLVAIEREPEESVTPEMMESFAKVKRICYIQSFLAIPCAKSLFLVVAFLDR